MVKNNDGQIILCDEFANIDHGITILFGDENDAVESLNLEDELIVYVDGVQYYAIVIIVGNKRFDGIDDIFSNHSVKYVILKLYRMHP